MSEGPENIKKIVDRTANFCDLFKNIGGIDIFFKVTIQILRKFGRVPTGISQQKKNILI